MKGDNASREAELRAKVRAVMPGVRADLERLARIPSVSAAGHDPEPVRRSAACVAEILAASGATVRVLEAPGAHPAVVGEVAGPPGAPRVLLYAHHDVQPEGSTGWLSHPYEPIERDGRLYGRGVADDKAGVLAHAAALRAWGGKPPVGVTIFVEGEEEAGSVHLREFLERERVSLRSDAVVVADSSNWRIGQPSLTVSLRGAVRCTVEVRTADHAVHSGVFGGPFPDALTALARLLATLHDERGVVRVPIATRDHADALDLTEAELRADAGARPGVRLLGEGTLTSRLWRQPAVSVLAIDAPTVAEASNQIVPVARAVVSMRIPPGEDAPAALLTLQRYLQAQAPIATWGADVTITAGSGGQPFEMKAQGPAYAAFRHAAAAAWGRAPLDVGSGGSIPFLADFRELFPDAAILVTGVEDPATNAHSENESLHLGEFENVCVAEALFFALFAPSGSG